jgi:enoyl-[acyl-carrier protein] reductase I
MSFLNLKDKTFLVMGVANRKSVAWFVGHSLSEEGAKVIYSVRTEERKQELLKRMPNAEIFVCDVEDPKNTEQLAVDVGEKYPQIDGVVHSIAFANFSEGLKPFQETKREDYLQACGISAFSFVEISNAFKPILSETASMVIIGISSTAITAENYGYMAPIKASLLPMARFLAKSFSHDTKVRFNVVGAGPLKTNSSAGIPGYMDNYLYAEKLTFRKEALKTQEVADAVLYLLSERSSGMNGSEMILDAGLSLNYFDSEIVQKTMRSNDQI